ncbi:MAG: Smr/MutS family protein [Desulfobacter sp.]|nr:MAG: Smr/MutS family protein [Desulfobacter sp.]
MSKSEKFKKKRGKTKKKNDLPVLGSDADFLSAFLEDDAKGAAEKGKPSHGKDDRANRVNKHGLPFIEDYEARFSQGDEIPEDGGDASPEETQSLGEDISDAEFSRLLDESLRTAKTPRHAPKPMPLKRRLKRYPRPEADLDLHGFTAIGAEIKARSFITTAKRQGYFTLRIIVGRGLHSEEGPVLPQVIEDLLKELKKDNTVLSYQWDGRKKGRSGAVIVYVRQFSD